MSGWDVLAWVIVGVPLAVLAAGLVASAIEGDWAAQAILTFVGVGVGIGAVFYVFDKAGWIG